ncbi:MAG: DNA adenine methylase [Chloroflexota bacterium]|nr:DNA adenine methylase [Chloroflexota bacterium]MDE2948000.1 DNA adenine methylase [Chloroflexota bacterium]
MIKQRADLTFKENIKKGRHGWVRLTPAYSVKLVFDILESNGDARHVLDPFSGTGTTGLACAELGINATLVDINPFLIWLAGVKTARYSYADLIHATRYANIIVDTVKTGKRNSATWTPPIHKIHRWWSSGRLLVLAETYKKICEIEITDPVRNLLLIAFCRLLIEWSNAAFNHQSMSFKESEQALFDETAMMTSAYLENVSRVVRAASKKIAGEVRIIETDSRSLAVPTRTPYDCVITSPPYSNRMSYIRELRPYMYWLGYLREAREAGELDWKAIGGTWGIATSRLATWISKNDFKSDSLDRLVSAVATESQVLANYIHKYMDDMFMHFCSLKTHLAEDATLHYIVGNSKFYETVIPVEQLYAEMMSSVGFTDVRIERIRKRNSKKELYEFLVSARN